MGATLGEREGGSGVKPVSNEMEPFSRSSVGSRVRNEGVRSTVVGPYEGQTMTEISLVVERVNRHLKLERLEDSRHGG